MPNEEERLKAIKEELEDMIDKIKNEVDSKDKDFADLKKRQDETFDIISYKMEQLKEEFKAFGKKSCKKTYNLFIIELYKANNEINFKSRKKWTIWRLSKKT